MKRICSLVFLFLLTLSLSATAQSLAMRNYPPVDLTVQLEFSNLPLLWITTTDTLSRYTRCLGRMKVINNAEGINYSDTVSHPEQTIEFDGPIAIKWRGASSFGNDGTQTKKPMSVKLLKTDDINGKKDKVALLGMGKDNDWCFLAPWQDRSYIRDVLTMELARGGYVFAPHMRYCEVFMDGIYYGLYILSERATNGSKRLALWDYGKDADDNAIDDETGDFHVEIDRPENKYSHEKEPHYKSQHHPVHTDGTEISDRYIIYQYKDPEEEDFEENPGAREAVHKAIDDMENAFASEDYRDLYADYIDVESFMDYEIAQEAANNIDAYRLSTPMWKHSITHASFSGGNDRWKMALWDFNLAYGGVSYFDARKNDIWRYAENDVMAAFTNWFEEQLNPFYWYKLMEDDTYVTSLRARYTQRRMNDYANDRIDALVDSLYTLISQESVARDIQAWKVNFNLLNNVTSVRNFIVNRLAWMDESWYDTCLLTDVPLLGSTLWKDGSWNTICLPFRLAKLEGTPLEGAVVKTLVSSDFGDGTLTLNFTKSDLSSLEAGRPYIVKWETGEHISDPVFKDVITTDGTAPVETEYVDFVGTFSPVTLQGEDRAVLYLGSSNMLHYPSEDVEIKPYHAYFRLKEELLAYGDDSEAPIRSIRFNIDDDNETDMIRSVTTNSRQSSFDDVWYTIDGIRLKDRPLTPGMYIHHGCIVVIH